MYAPREQRFAGGRTTPGRAIPAAASPSSAPSDRFPPGADPPVLLPTLTIARNTLVESLRQPVFFVILLISAIAQYLSTAATGYSMGYRNIAGEVTGDTKLLFDIGLATVFTLGIVLAAFIATAAISREIDNKTVLTVVSKPIGRASVVIGKFLGVAAAMLIASVILVLHLLYAIHHGVLSTAADTAHVPVLVFGVGAFAVSLLIASLGNFWYGWSFPQTFVLWLLPLSVIAYVLMLPFEADWRIKPPEEIIPDQVLLACAGVMLALLVMSAVATAASTRLGQVMTMVVTLGVFSLGLLSDHFLGRHVYDNQRLSRVAIAEPVDRVDENFLEPGAAYRVELEEPPAEQLEPGDPFFYGPSPDGLGLITPEFAAPADDVDLSSRVYPPGTAPAIVVAEVRGDRDLVIRHIGVRPLNIDRPPQRGDWLFTGPTDVNPFAFAAWGIIPNLHHYWLVDAVTQVHRIPLSHLGMIAGYAALQILACVAIAILLFQGRDVG